VRPYFVEPISVEARGGAESAAWKSALTERSLAAGLTSRPVALASRRAAVPGRDVVRAVGEYRAAVTRLAFLRARLARGAVDGRAADAWHAEALAQVRNTRTHATDLALDRPAGPATHRPPPMAAEPS
jgi:hypothetical protein